MNERVSEEDGRTGGGGGGRSGYRTKNKNPTRQCGELAGLNGKTTSLKSFASMMHMRS